MNKELEKKILTLLVKGCHHSHSWDSKCSKRFHAAPIEFCDIDDPINKLFTGYERIIDFIIESYGFEITDEMAEVLSKACDRNDITPIWNILQNRSPAIMTSELYLKDILRLSYNYDKCADKFDEVMKAFGLDPTDTQNEDLARTRCLYFMIIREILKSYLGSEEAMEDYMDEHDDDLDMWLTVIK